VTMKHHKLQHNYHDASLAEVRFNDDELTVVADLDEHWNNQCAERAYLIFHQVKNMDEVRTQLAEKPSGVYAGIPDEIIGIEKRDKTHYLIDFHRAGGVTIECRGFSEI
jgi:hypothetical protein